MGATEGTHPSRVPCPLVMTAQRSGLTRILSLYGSKRELCHWVLLSARGLALEHVAEVQHFVI